MEHPGDFHNYWTTCFVYSDHDGPLRNFQTAKWRTIRRNVEKLSDFWRVAWAITASRSNLLDMPAKNLYSDVRIDELPNL
jgi:hypothetical protein